MEGMGIVRQGPAIVSPSKQQQQQQQQHPLPPPRTSSAGFGGAVGSGFRRQSAMPTTQDPYSIDFRPTLPPSASRPNKRPFSPPAPHPPSAATIPASSPLNPSTAALQFTSPLESPAKRTHFSPSPTPSSRVLATGPTRQQFDFTSPTKAYFGPVTITAGPSASKASSSQLSSKSPRALLGFSPAKDGPSDGVGGVRGLLFSHKDKTTDASDENVEHRGASRMLQGDNDGDTTPRAPHSQSQPLPQSHSRPSYISSSISNSSQKRMASIFPSATPVPSTSLDASSSEDELDFLSPRKKLAIEQERALKRREKETRRQYGSAGRASLGAIRSPPPQSASSSSSSSSQGLKRASMGLVGDVRTSFGTSLGAEMQDLGGEKMDVDVDMSEEEPKRFEGKVITSAPMSRQSFAFPPPAHSMSQVTASLPSYIHYTVRPLPQQQATIDPSLISFQSLPPSTSAVSQIATGAATPRGGPTPTATRTHAYTASLSGHPTPSGIPRLIRPRSSTITALNTTLPSVAPPIAPSAATPQAEHTSPDPSPPETEADLSTSSTISTTSSISSISSGGSEETASRLKHLQDMLSRLAMPRQQHQAPGVTGAKARGMEASDGLVDLGLGLGAKGAASGTKVRSGVMAKREKVMTSSSTTSTSSRDKMGVDRERIRKRQSDVPLGTARYREEYTVPLKGGDDAAPAQAPPRPPPAAVAPVTGKRKLERTKSFGGENDRAPLGDGFGFGSASSRSNTNLATTSTATAPAAGSSSTVPTVPARRISMLPSSSSTAPIGSMSSIDSNGATATKGKILRGVVAFVDVRTAEGDDAGMMFVDMLKSMGARVTVRPSSTLTHIIFKSGRPGTLQRYRQIPEANKPFLVGISWIVRCAELWKRVDEKDFTVIDKTATTSKGSTGAGVGGNSQAKELIAAMQKRRRSMEPKAYAALSSTIGPSSSTSTDPGVKALIAASIERARRKSLQYAPKVGSPLAKRVFMMPPEEEEDEDDEEAMRT